MSEIITFEAELRDRAGKGAARATRRTGRVPAVIYGNKSEAVMISLDPKLLKMELHRAGFFSRLIDIKVNGKTERTLPRDIQLHPVSDEPLHVDFVRVTSETRTHVAVTVIFDNQDKSPGIKRGGVLNIVRHELEVVCAADSIPQSIHIDLTDMEIGDSVHISSVKLPDGVSPAVADRDFTVATIAAPNVETSEDAAEEAAAAATSAT